MASKSVDYQLQQFAADLSASPQTASPNLFGANGELLRSTDFDPKLYQNNFNTGIRLPTFYDLCGNGGLLADKPCDIDGNGSDDNLPRGPLHTSLSVTEANFPQYLTDFEVQPFISYLAALYSDFDEDFSLDNYIDLVPGVIPYQRYDQAPSRYLVKSDFMPSRRFSHDVVFPDLRQAAKDFPFWFRSVANNTEVVPLVVPRNSWNIVEQNTAAYFELDIVIPNTELELNMGARMVRTLLTVDKAVVSEQPKVSFTTEPWYLSGIGTGFRREKSRHEHWSFLPSVNVNWHYAPRRKMSFHLASVVSQANYLDLARGQHFFYQGQRNFVDDVVREREVFVSGSEGNPALTPYRLNQLDLQWERYGARSFVHLGYYYKRFISFVSDSSEVRAVKDFSPEGYSKGVVSSSKNSGGGYVQGFELAYQYRWDGGFGFLSNFTYMDDSSKGKNNDLATNFYPGLSRELASLTPYFENTWLNLRLSYTWRSAYLSPYFVDRAVAGGLAMSSDIEVDENFDAHGNLDGRVSVNASDSLKFSLDVFNILNEDTISRLNRSRHTYAHSYTERRMQLGVTWSF